jgi:hypothetical protein
MGEKTRNRAENKNPAPPTDMDVVRLAAMCIIQV